MTTREDFTIDYQDSPRIIEIVAPSTEVTMQDLVDTLRIEEEKFSGGGTFPHLINASGKEPLGGGVFVGITTSLQNALVSFQARTTPAETGTVTTGSSAPVNGKITFVDSTADFTAALVKRGSLVINFTDQSIADVVSVTNGTTLVTKTLVNGIGNDYEVGDVYHVFNIIQVNASGGNITAVDDLAAELDPLLPTAFTQIVKSSASSATLQSFEENTYFSAGGIHVDPLNGVSGTVFPTGTPGQRSNNITDARTIADNVGLPIFVVYSEITLDQPYPDWQFKGHGFAPIVNLAGFDVNASFFLDISLMGVMNGQIKAMECAIDTVTGMKGIFQSCGIKGANSLIQGVTVTFDKCYSAVPGLSTPSIDFGVGGGNTSANIRAYSGGLAIFNMDGAGDKLTIEFVAGRAVMDATCTNGTAVLRGVASVQDDSAGTTVDKNSLVEGWRLQFAEQILANNYILSDANGDMTITLDDGTSLVSKAYADIAKTTPWTGTGAILARDKFVVV